jgi:hypothetical protein
MTQERSSPFLILGVPFGAHRNEVAKGFARAVRRLKKLDDPPFQLEDLNWAQHEIDHRMGLAEHSLEDFRVPADATAYDLPDFTRGTTENVVALERRSSPTDPKVVDQLRIEVVADAVIEAVRDSLSSADAPALPASFVIREDSSNAT